MNHLNFDNIPGRPPSREQIAPHKSLDEMWACEKFHGKNRKQAMVLFEDGASSACEDLMWMGPAAFQYYVFCAIQYILGDSSKDDIEILSSFACIIEFRIEHEPSSLINVLPYLRDAITYVLAHLRDFEDVDSEEEYTEMKKRYSDMLNNLPDATTRPETG